MLLEAHRFVTWENLNSWPAPGEMLWPQHWGSWSKRTAAHPRLRVSTEKPLIWWQNTLLWKVWKEYIQQPTLTSQYSSSKLKTPRFKKITKTICKKLHLNFSQVKSACYTYFTMTIRHSQFFSTDCQGCWLNLTSWPLQNRYCLYKTLNSFQMNSELVFMLMLLKKRKTTCTLLSLPLKPTLPGTAHTFPAHWDIMGRSRFQPSN